MAGPSGPSSLLRMYTVRGTPKKARDSSKKKNTAYFSTVHHVQKCWDHIR